MKCVGIVHMDARRTSVMYWVIILTLSGPLGLTWCGAHWLTTRLAYLVFLLCIVVSNLNAHVVTCDMKCMGIVPMHEWKVSLTYWGMLSSPCGPLGRLGQVVDTMVLQNLSRNQVH